MAAYVGSMFQRMRNGIKDIQNALENERVHDRQFVDPPAYIKAGMICMALFNIRAIYCSSRNRDLEATWQETCKIKMSCAYLSESYLDLHQTTCNAFEKSDESLIPHFCLDPSISEEAIVKIPENQEKLLSLARKTHLTCSPFEEQVKEYENMMSSNSLCCSQKHYEEYRSNGLDKCKDQSKKGKRA